MKSFDEYVDYCLKNRHMPHNDLQYWTIAFVGEAGEVANEVKKQVRDQEDRTEQIKLELGDALHYLIDVAASVGLSMQDVITANINKLNERHGANPNWKN